MKILMLSWEYPPRIVGGLSRHVQDLSRVLSQQNEVHVLSVRDENLPEFEVDENVYVHRVMPYNIQTEDFNLWVTHMNMAMMEEGTRLFRNVDFDIIHAHDWLVAYAARFFKNIYRIPLLSTIHATEFGRNRGLYNDSQRYISNVEWFLTYESWKVICCSRYMMNELKYIFNIPPDKIRVIPNGVRIDEFERGYYDEIFRARYARPNEKIIFFIGRLVHEKGLDILIEAMPMVLNQYADVKLVVAGTGPKEEDYKRKVSNMGLGNKVLFTGYIDDETRVKLYNNVDIAVFPSLYEPFGIVALEAMAAKVPVIVSDVGGFKEIIDQGYDGIKVQPENPQELASAILKLLFDEEYAKLLYKRAYAKVKKDYKWEDIGKRTMDVYNEILLEFATSPWYRENRKPIPEKIGNREEGIV
ncbi:MAG: glycosyltransferase family 4 protein [Thermoanaerobacterium sp.]|nr:glycosyltransferase family 4 protein [Thermoanaerobacterium sp.]